MRGTYGEKTRARSIQIACDTSPNTSHEEPHSSHVTDVLRELNPYEQNQPNQPYQSYKSYPSYQPCQSCQLNWPNQLPTDTNWLNRFSSRTGRTETSQNWHPNPTRHGLDRRTTTLSLLCVLIFAISALNCCNRAGGHASSGLRWQLHTDSTKNNSYIQMRQQNKMQAYRCDNKISSPNNSFKKKGNPSIPNRSKITCCYEHLKKKKQSHTKTLNGAQKVTNRDWRGPCGSSDRR